MRQAITTKFIGPTNHKGARVKAVAQAGSITVSWDYRLGIDDNHRVAASVLMEKFSWSGKLVGGWDHKENGVFVITDR